MFCRDVGSGGMCFAGMWDLAGCVLPGYGIWRDARPGGNMYCRDVRVGGTRVFPDIKQARIAEGKPSAVFFCGVAEVSVLG